MSGPDQIPPAGALAIPYREAAALEGMERRAKWCIPGGVALLAVGALLLGNSSTGAVRLVGGLAAFCGPGFIWSFACWRRLFAQARESLKEPPRDFLLERRYQLSRTEAWKTRLWSTHSQQRPVAWFGMMQWSAPMFMTADTAPARVYGAPRNRAVVVVSCAEGVIVGRISLSHFDDDRTDARPPRGVGWLFKPRTLPLSRR
jgi:hypothetical protein